MIWTLNTSFTIYTINKKIILQCTKGWSNVINQIRSLSLIPLFCPLRQVADYLEEFQSRASDNAEDMKTRLNPYFTQVRDNAQAKITTLNSLLRSQVDNMRETIQTTAEDIKERFQKTTEDMRSTLEDKMVELNNWFQPFVSMFSTNM